MKYTWILVADNTLARFFTAETPSSPLQEFDELSHAKSRLHDREITTDLPGRIKSADGGGHAFEQPSDPKQHEADNFAHQVAQYLKNAYNANQFKHLLIVAEPSFLGLLHHRLSAAVKNTICYELDKNISLQHAAEIRKHLPEYLPHSLT